MAFELSFIDSKTSPRLADLSTTHSRVSRFNGDLEARREVIRVSNGESAWPKFDNEKLSEYFGLDEQSLLLTMDSEEIEEGIVIANLMGPPGIGTIIFPHSSKVVRRELSMTLVDHSFHLDSKQEVIEANIWDHKSTITSLKNSLNGDLIKFAFVRARGPFHCDHDYMLVEDYLNRSQMSLKDSDIEELKLTKGLRHSIARVNSYLNLLPEYLELLKVGGVLFTQIPQCFYDLITHMQGAKVRFSDEIDFKFLEQLCPNFFSNIEQSGFQIFQAGLGVGIKRLF